MDNCIGDGMCLIQTATGHEQTGCIHGCRDHECPNFSICGNKCPQWVFDCHGGRCMTCAISHWDLKFKSDEECPICLEATTCASSPKCTHYICVDCFKRIYYGNPSNPPSFPYPSEIEREYDENPEHEKWRNDPLIIKYN